MTVTERPSASDDATVVDDEAVGPGSAASAADGQDRTAGPRTPTGDLPLGGLAGLKPFAEIVGILGAQLSILGSVLIYFGTVATRVEAGFFGLDANQLGYSNQELVVRSIAPMLGPLAVGAALAVFVLQLNAAAADRVERIEAWPAIRWAVPLATTVGLALVAGGAIWQWRLGSRHSYWSPLFLGTGGMLIICGRGTAALLRRRSLMREPVGGGEGPVRPTSLQVRLSPVRALDAPSKLVLGFVLIFAAFGFTARLAESDGFRRANSQVSRLDERSRVSVLSEEPLLVNRRGVACLPVEGSRFTRRYLGLHLLAYRESRFFLVPEGFDVNNAVVIVLPDGPEVRVEYDASPRLRSAHGLPPSAPVGSPDPDLRC